MALINCKECNSEIGDEAFDCPRCGVSLKKPKRTLIGKIIKWTFILYNVMMLLKFISGLMNGLSSIVMLVLPFWAAGDIILGLLVFLTKPKK